MRQPATSCAAAPVRICETTTPRSFEYNGWEKNELGTKLTCIYCLIYIFYDLLQTYLCMYLFNIDLNTVPLR